MHTLVVDDEREIAGLDGAVYARTAAEAIDLLRIADSLEELWLDHDLGDGGNGYTVASYLERRAQTGSLLPIKRVVIHSMNPVGAQRMRRALERFYKIDIVPYASLVAGRSTSLD